ncbi:CAP domain-containing protein [Ensifer soli]|uniref:CAP domain-containing protein n=1 Tax=Ciceribacter sp. sgz301302 TaxID=3342379 RepID=UPI0035B7C535
MAEAAFLPSRRIALRLGGLGALGLLASCTTSRVLLPETGTGEDQTEAMLAAVNALRGKKGLAPLEADPKARAAALDQAARMARAGRMEHNIGFGADFGKRMNGQGVTLPAAENIASGQREAARAFQAWVDSPKHLANMLGRPYRGLGVAVARNPVSGERPYWAMVLSG